MNQYELRGELREGGGKGAARRLRREGMIPAVLYGAGKDAVAIKLDANSVHKQVENEAFFSHILEVKVDGENTQAVLKALQRDPTTDQIVHMDLLRVSSSKEITMHVPLHFINEETCPGKKAGGVVNHLLVDLEISCLPKDLPEFIAVDMAAMEIGDSLHLSQLTMPAGVTLLAIAQDPEHDQPVVSIQHSQKFEEEEVLAEGEELEEGVAAAGEAEAPAAEGAPGEGEES
ncbi:MAG: 50S ribosomal protein L25/general stress protein Ctc [Gammaproteobacteria bacterium]|nr:50S ribosomal protein L25/general stress protein Ctc [Gammaproteobacteria bacterium]NIM74469.1 50S ribosomal protein L25/general stress protein Ctc [Gammaproteobacteria bacterium]NIO26302.1 50S ribosomal protein L25/general stress protein Ctc [Gammaproteobacteria bacterium]NIO66854.1 50S ribosomal protein L25/general stress protein Ctc [Gammaproteobacteria bacterium]NIP45165.1 50S ribosomal protein L25/general stress protein Ctc [Gammaproteobacteria bacterium]